LSVEFEPVNVDNKLLFRTKIMGIGMDVFDQHGLFNDKGISYEDYNYEIDFEIFDHRDYKYINDMLIVLVKYVAEVITANVTTKKIILVDDLQEIIEFKK